MEPFTQALLDRAKSLVGEVLRGVHYESPSERSGEANGEANLTNARVDLYLDGETLSVYSSDEFTDGSFELSLGRGSAPVGRSDVDFAPASDEQQWSDVIGQQILTSKIHWVDSPYVAITKRRKAFSSHHFDVDGAIPFSGPQAPLALELHFANAGRVLLVSGGWKGVNQPIVETGSGISVLWDGDSFATLVPRIARELKKTW